MPERMIRAIRNRYVDPPAGRRWWTGLLARQVQMVLDLAALVSALAAAYALRFLPISVPGEGWRAFVVRSLPVLAEVLLVQVVMMSAWGVYSYVWRYVGISELKAFTGAFASSAAILGFIRLFGPERFQDLKVPLSVILIDAVLALGGVLGLRITRRLIHEEYERSEREAAGPPESRARVLLVGAGRAGVMAAREIKARGYASLAIVGFVDDDPVKHGSVINEVKVLGTSTEIPWIAREHQVDQVIITIAKASRSELRRIVEICEVASLKVRIIPGLFEILDGSVRVSQIRDVEIEDLLGRDPVRLDETQVIGFVANRVVMVTGAGGSIGSELVRQVLRFSPARVLLVERSEFALYEIHRELAARWPGRELVPLLADVGDAERMGKLFKAHHPHVVLHAAAYKHVPMVECNTGEAVKNNVIGTQVVGEMAGEFGAEAFVMISTDKAVNPTSVMGATKRAAELVVQMLDRRFATRFVAVRFGNVLGSTGSVVPLFREQIARGGPVTVTDPEMKRYFMTIPEATQLVLQAGALAAGGEIFILDMGDPVKIVDLARDMIRLSGLKPDEDIAIEFTGVRPGEKLFEELGTTADRVTETKHRKIFVGRIPEASPGAVVASVSRLGDLARAGNDAGLRMELQRLIPEATVGGQQVGVVADVANARVVSFGSYGRTGGTLD